MLSLRLRNVTACSALRKFSRAFSSAPSVTLYQYAICPFCNMTKSVMAYSKSDYTTVEVNPLTRREIQWSKEYRKVPIATIDGTSYFGSDKIIDGLLANDAVRREIMNRWNGSDMDFDEFIAGPSSKRWTTYARDELAPLLYPNICRTLGDSYTAFGYVAQVEQFSFFQKAAIRGVGAFAMYMAASKVKKKRKITDERQVLEEAFVELEKDGLGGQNFLSGKGVPHLGDLIVFGTLKAIEGLPAHDELVCERRGPLRDWYERMNELTNTQ